MTISDKTRDILEWILCIVIAFVLAIVVKYFVGTPTIVSQVSMKPTLMPGQRLILNRWMRTINEMPQRGEIITFEAPSKVAYSNSLEVNLQNPVAKYSIHIEIDIAFTGFNCHIENVICHLIK